MSDAERIVELERRLAAAESERDRYRSRFDAMDQGYCELELIRAADGQVADQRLLSFNPAFERLFGISGAQPMGKRVSEILPELHALWKENLERVAQTGKPERLEQSIPRLDSWFEVQVHRDREDRLTVFCEDVTKRHESEAALGRSEERFRAFVVASSDTVYRMSPDWSEMRELDGHGFLADTTQPTASWMDHYILPDDKAAVRAAIDRAIDTKSPFQLDHRIVTKDGTIGWTVSRAVPVIDDQGDVFEWLGTASDITARRQADDRQAFLLELSDALRPLGDPYEIMATATRILGQHLHVTRARYWELDESGEFLDSSGGYSDNATSVSQRVRISDFGAYVKIGYNAGRTLSVADVLSDPRVSADELRFYETFGFRAWAGVPLVKDGDFVAVLGLHNATPRAWTKTEIALIKETAEQTWAAVTRARIEVALRESESRLQVLIAELQHRVRNILAVVRSVFTRTAQTSNDIEELTRHFRGRLDALARTHVIVTRQTGGTAALEDLFRDELLSAGVSAEPKLMLKGGPEVELDARTAESIGLAIHELTTNSLKYGALAHDKGAVEICWFFNLDQSDNRKLFIKWAEQGVPTLAVAPNRQGFGRELIEDILPYQLQAETSLEFRGGGVRCSIAIPWPETAQ